MIDALPLLLGPEGYQISRSVRLRSSASAYFNRTLTTPTSGSIWTYSLWVKRGALNSNQQLLSAGASVSDQIYFQGGGTDKLIVYLGASQTTTQVFRDPSAWYHFVFAVDTTQATASNRLKIYLNGSQITAFDATGYPTQNSTTKINSAVAHYIGRYAASASDYVDGYLTEINFIDGQALTPASFGETNSVTGVWQPKKYTGTYGTNGFYLNFSDNSAATAAAIGKDYSGNGNNWTPNNISVTAGVTYDSMLDVPTQWADGGNGRGNYCTWNPLDKGTVTVSNANLSAVSAADTHAIRATMELPQSGKWYWETTVSGLGYGSVLGIASPASIVTTGPSSAATRTYQWGSWFNTFNSGVVQYGTNQGITGGANWSGASQLATDDVLMIAVDMDNGSMWVGKNGTWFNSSGTANPATNTDPRWTGLTGTSWFAYYSSYGSTSPPTANANFGQRPFAYTPPTGFKALNTLNLPTPTILKGNQYFNAVLWTGDNTNSRTITGVGFQPDLVWAKSRSNAQDNLLLDSVRGGTFNLISNSTAQEFAASAFSGGAIDSTASDGFTVVRGSTNGNNVNQSAFTYVAWNWKEGATQGFDIVTYTGTGVARTVAHSLGVAPKMMIVKLRSTTGAWGVYHGSLAASQVLYLNTTDAVDGSGIWNSTAPTSSVFSVGAHPTSNPSGQTLVAYLFAEVAGFSKFGSYTGNGSTDGAFLFCGFRPRFVMVKQTNAVGNWLIWDTARSNNQMQDYLVPNSSAAEANNVLVSIDALSNGFKCRTADNDINGSGDTYIFAAFAESPFKFSLAR